MASLMRGKFRDALKKYPELFNQVPKKVWRTDCFVNIKAVGKGKSALKYLALYIFSIAITNKRIVALANGKVTFGYRDNRGRWRKETLEAEKFMSRFLQHVLPSRFVKVRYYGFLSLRKRKLLEAIKELFALFESNEEKSGSACDLASEVRVMCCPKCGGEMRFVKELKPERWRAPPWLLP